jgi:hypothetical protein
MIKKERAKEYSIIQQQLNQSIISHRPWQSQLQLTRPITAEGIQVEKNTAAAMITTLPIPPTIQNCSTQIKFIDPQCST